MLVLRSLLFNIAFYAFISVALLLILPVFVLPRRWGWNAVRFWGIANLWMLRHIAGVKVDIRGREHIKPGGYLVASKHQSAWETFALVPLFADPTFILKRELMHIPFFGWYAARFRMLPIDRGRGSAVLPALTERTKKAVAEGRQVIIFPEGTRRPAGAEPAYKFGVAHLYANVGCECLPIALNSGLYWPRRTFLRYPGTIIVDILPPIPPGLSTSTFHRTLKAEIEAASARLIEEAAASDSPPPLAQVADNSPTVAGTSASD
ncbi:1-acyl-sn-glycerol-3-phosphate acyltransferase [Rhodobium orientis]|uniref:1-acyl-sn-glycerol-3-phosphate acyltransferase n=1 Tax=Rhodobium orientis TaxID=34017 RepID=A0A327JFZ9_9HYPH|nr:lysophospholipid acyltransferase family protein [Rhodobium orientis]MBB4303579.1 1-acyl-sn-glycerol-3-phosphate acyltransferase [Rhodobium orientis]MBK5951964.1 1-acyl-sn-glycerol-3-phosphate acyltransferase [Rhodobium orientis]RAI24861.1 1-acyl-sn-glycerol-3-phosphate acyltransferase [Rhodobium orientis]